jgi:hypothetical protein
MCRSNVIIYENETKFEIYWNDKTESHHITQLFFESVDKHHNLDMDKVTHYTYCDFPGYSKCGKNILCLIFLWLFFLWLFFLWLFFLLVLWLFILWLFSCYFSSVYHLCIVYIISHLLEEMYENQISVLLKFHVLLWKDKILSASVIFGN